MPRYKKPQHIAKDIIILLVSLFAGFILYKSNIVINVGQNANGISLIVAFIAGIFFTSAFTIAPAGVVLAELMKTTPVFEVALMGSIGAVIGDLIIFLFIRDSLCDDLNYMLKVVHFQRYKVLFHRRFFRFVTPLIGGLIIASPLPDEIGLAMMGLSKVRTSVLIPITFGMNFVGIILIAVLTHAL